MAVLKSPSKPEVRFENGKVFLRADIEQSIDKSYYRCLLIGLTYLESRRLHHKQNTYILYMQAVCKYPELFPLYLQEQRLKEVKISLEMAKNFVVFLFPEIRGVNFFVFGEFMEMREFDDLVDYLMEDIKRTNHLYEAVARGILEEEDKLWDGL